MTVVRTCADRIIVIDFVWRLAGLTYLGVICLVGPFTLCFLCLFFFFQAEDGIRDVAVTGVQTCALPISRQAGGERDQPVLVPLQHFAVDARPAVIALEEADGRERDEVAVTGAVAGEQHEVRVVGGGAAQPLAPPAAPEGEVRLEPEDRPDVAGLRLRVELPGPVEVAVIGDRQRVHAECLDVVQQIGNAVGAVEEGVFAVRVEVYERHLDYRAPARRSSSSSTRSRGSRFASSSTRRW